MRVFQRALFNTNKELCDIREMYFRTDSNENFSDYFLLKKGQFFETSTYFNSLSIEKIKKYTNISDVSLQIEFKGSLKLSFFHVNNNMESVKLFESKFDNLERSTQTIALDAWDSIGNGLVYFRVDANDDVELFDFCYSTSTPESQKVKLAIVITHFNRQNYLLSALRRIQADIFNNNENINIIVSDNSQNLDFENTDRIKIYKNKNYGGSGGFTFGLLKAMEQGYTHCLFMDDDASTESECILRTYDLLQYSVFSDLAITGTMLFEEKKNVIHESGAFAEKYIFPLDHGKDTLLLESLIKYEAKEISYGAWWFFAFPVSHVKTFPFPFFVRGDDICFGISNNFKILSINGICSWQEDFKNKHNTMTHYLSVRSNAVIMLNFSNIFGVVQFFKGFIFSVLKGVLTNNYDQSIIALKAYKDLVFDREMWLNDMDMSRKRAEIKNSIIYEFYKNYNFSSLDVDYGVSKKNNENFLLKFFRIMTLNGLLVPSFFYKKDLVVIPKNYYRLSDVFLRKNILYVDVNNQTAFHAMHNKKVAFLILLKSFVYLFVLLFMYPVINRFYSRHYSGLTKKEFWSKTLNLN